MDFNKMQGQAGMCANDLDFFIIQWSNSISQLTSYLSGQLSEKCP
jgi:hypothetical protein